MVNSSTPILVNPSEPFDNELIDLTPRLRELGDGEAELPDPEKHHGEGSWKPRSRDFH